MPRSILDDLVTWLMEEEQAQRRTTKRKNRRSPKRAASSSPTSAEAGKDSAVYPWTPRYTFHLTSGLCAPLRNRMGVEWTGLFQQEVSIPCLSNYGVKILGFKDGVVLSNGSGASIEHLSDWQDRGNGQPFTIGQFLEITVRGDHHVPYWAEYLLEQERQATNAFTLDGYLDERHPQWVADSKGRPRPWIASDCHLTKRRLS